MSADETSGDTSAQRGIVNVAPLARKPSDHWPLVGGPGVLSFSGVMSAKPPASASSPPPPLPQEGAQHPPPPPHSHTLMRPPHAWRTLAVLGVRVRVGMPGVRWRYSGRRDTELRVKTRRPVPVAHYPSHTALTVPAGRRPGRSPAPLVTACRGQRTSCSERCSAAHRAPRWASSRQCRAAGCIDGHPARRQSGGASPPTRPSR